MKILNLPVELRSELGSANARRYRRAGKVPCNLYGRGHENLNLVADADDVKKVLKAHSALVKLKLEDRLQTALLREVNWGVFGDHVQHIDLVRVEMEDEVRIKVPVHCVGIPAGTSEGGQLQVVKPDLDVFSRVDNIPSEIRIDVSHLHIHDGVYISEVEYPAGVRPDHDAKELVVHLTPPRKVEEEAPVELAEGEEAPAVEGEEPADADKPDGGKDKHKDKD